MYAVFGFGFGGYSMYEGYRMYEGYSMYEGKFSRLRDITWGDSMYEAYSMYEVLVFGWE